jgi:hypothetical protein
VIQDDWQTMVLNDINAPTLLATLESDIHPRQKVGYTTNMSEAVLQLIREITATHLPRRGMVPTEEFRCAIAPLRLLACGPNLDDECGEWELHYGPLN